jgi:MFS family permease
VVDKQHHEPGDDAVQAPLVKPRVFYGYILVLASACVMALFAGTLAAFGVFFKPVLTEFGWTRAMTSGAFSLSWILQGLLAVVMGKFTDKYGPRAVISFCGLLVGFGYVLMAQVQTIGQLYLFYGIIGTGMSGSNVSLVSTVARWFVRRRGIMAGFILAGGGIGALITPPLANWLITNYDWRRSYVVLGCLVLVFVLVAAQFLRRDPAQKGQLPYGYDEEKSPLKSPTKGLSLREAIRTRQFWMIFVLFFGLGFCAYVIVVHIAPHATDLGIPADRAARILATIGGLAIIGRVVMGNLGDTLGNRQAFMISFVLMSVALLWLTVVKSAGMLYALSAAIGFTWGSGALGSPLVAEFFGLRSLGENLGVINFGYSIGAALGPFIAGYVFDVSQSYRVAFLLTAVVAISALMSTILLKPGTKGAI